MTASTTTKQQVSASVGSPTSYYLINLEAHLRSAGRLAEVVGVVDPEAARLARIIFRLAQRVATDAGRLERVA